MKAFTNCSYILLLILLTPYLACTQERIQYSIPGHIEPLKQPDTNLCWITVATMMLSWRDKINYSIEEILDKYERIVPFDDSEKSLRWYYNKNKGLTHAIQDKFSDTFGLKKEPPASSMLERYLDLLMKHGPLWIMTTAERGVPHARLLIAVDWNGNYETSSCTFIDPEKGEVVKQQALAFVTDFERYAKIQLEYDEEFYIQIYHF